MKKIIHIALASFMILAASAPSMAKHHEHKNKKHGYEQTYRHKNKKHHDRPAPHELYPGHRGKKHQKNHYHKHQYSGRGFDDLVYRASYGYPNVQVYSMGNNIYVVRYKRHGHYYMRQINVVNNTMMAPQAITLNDNGWYLTSRPSYYYIPNGAYVNLNIGGGPNRPNVNINIPISH